VGRATFRNRTAWAIWIFMAIWMTFLGLMTWVVFRDGPPTGYSWPTMWAILALFWTFGGAGTVWASTIRIVHVVVTDTGALDVTWRWPFRVERRRVEAADVPKAEMFYGRDSDGDPYFTSRVTLRDGATIDLAESHDEAAVEAATAQFNATAGDPWSTAAKAGMIE
jgi:hypothetical protein